MLVKRSQVCSSVLLSVKCKHIIIHGYQCARFVFKQKKKQTYRNLKPGYFFELLRPGHENIFLQFLKEKWQSGSWYQISSSLRIWAVVVLRDPLPLQVYFIGCLGSFLRSVLYYILLFQPNSAEVIRNQLKEEFFFTCVSLSDSSFHVYTVYMLFLIHKHTLQFGQQQIAFSSLKVYCESYYIQCFMFVIFIFLML